MNFSAYYNQIFLNKSWQIAILILAIAFALKSISRNYYKGKFITNLIIGWIGCNFTFLFIFYIAPYLMQVYVLKLFSVVTK